MKNKIIKDSLEFALISEMRMAEIEGCLNAIKTLNNFFPLLVEEALKELETEKKRRRSEG